MTVHAARDLIEERYAAVHGAIPATDFPHFCIIDGEGAAPPSAALGFREARDGPLFLEAYLDAPIESLVSKALARPLARDTIVEIGAHASRRSRDTLALWAHTAVFLDRRAEIVVAVLTQPMRSMLTLGRGGNLPVGSSQPGPGCGGCRSVGPLLRSRSDGLCGADCASAPQVAASCRP